MANEWPITTLADEVDLLTGFPFKSDQYTNSKDGIPLLRGDNIVQGRFRWDDVKRWPASRVIDLQEYFLRPGDIVVAMDRPWIEAGLKYACVTEYDLPCLLVQRVARLRAKETLDQGFLKYIIGTQDFTNYILGVQTGTAVPHISGGQIKEYRFRRPPLKEQRLIASILGSLDDKIELNHRMNAVLEEIALSLFKSWFIDFDPVRAKIEGRQLDGLDAETAALFPERLGESELGLIPEGWEIKPLDKIADFINGLPLQKYGTKSDNYLPALKIRDLRQGFTDAGSDHVSLDIDPSYIIRDGDVIFSWSGSLLVDIWTGGPAALNQHLFKVSSSDYPRWFYYLWVREHLFKFQQIAADKATTMGHIQRGHLSTADVVVPPAYLLEQLHQIIAPLIDMMIQARLESRGLGKTRDALLPMLLTGKLDIGSHIIGDRT